jgi:predicted transcriptional regulator
MNEKKTMQVREVMNQDFQLIDGLTVVRDALRIMKQRDACALIVEKRHDGDEYGIVLVSDIAKKVLAEDRSPDRVNVYEIMSKPVIAVSPSMDIRYCARLFENFGIAVAPVIDDGQVMGMVGYDEIVLNGLVDLQDV